MEIRKLHFATTESKTFALRSPFIILSKFRLIEFEEVKNKLQNIVINFMDAVKEAVIPNKENVQSTSPLLQVSTNDTTQPESQKPRRSIRKNLKRVMTALLSKIKRIFGRHPAKQPGRFSKRKLVLSSLVVVVTLVSAFAIRSLVSISINNSKNTSGAADQRIDVLGAKATYEINKEFSFPLLDEKGKEVSRIKYYINSVELRDEIVVQGKKATSVKGRTFLILNMKISNVYDQAIKMNTRDYVRLTRNGNEGEKLAADIHNDPVEVQAISTKYTRLGFPINDTDTNLSIFVGELNKDKEKIELNF